MQYLSVKNLTKFQHYKHRNPPWIKLYREFWSDYTLRQLSVGARLLFMGICSLAAELENKIPADPKYLSDRLGFQVASKMLAELTSQDSTLLCLYSDSTLREQVASAALADCKHDASKRNGKTSVPDPWVLSEDEAVKWRKFGINPYVEFAAFKDHALSIDRRCKDWPAALRNWLRKSVTMQEARK